MEEEHSVDLFGTTFIVVVFTGHQVSVCPQERGARETKQGEDETAHSWERKTYRKKITCW